MAKALAADDFAVLEAHVAAGDRVAYYTQLAQWGYDYGRLALGVVNNDTLAGATANIFFLDAAATQAQGVTIDPDTLAQISIELMQADFAARQESPLVAAGQELTYDIVQGFHQSVFARYGVSSDAWTPSLALDFLQTPEEKQALWAEMMASSAVLSYLAVIASVFDGTTDEAILNYIGKLSAAGGLAGLSPSNEFGNFDVSLGGGGRLIGDDQNDDLTVGTVGNDILMGFAGVDTMKGHEGSDRLYGGLDEDFLVGGDGADILNGGSEADIVVGGNSAVSAVDLATLNMRESHAEWDEKVGDTLSGDDGTDQYLIYGKEGETWDWAGLFEFNADKAAALLALIDTLDESGGDGNGRVWLQYEGSEGLEQIKIGGAYTDVYIGTEASGQAGVTFYTGAGPDLALYYIEQYDGTSIPYLFVMAGYPSSPVLAIKNFYQGDFGIYLPSFDRIRPDDTQSAPTSDPEPIEGGSGQDTLDYSLSTGGVDVNLATGVGSGGDAEGDTYTSIENVFGSNYGDTIVGNSSDNVLFGGEGNDQLFGGGGDDIVDGQAGNDIIALTSGSSTAEGGEGTDTLVISGNAADFEFIVQSRSLVTLTGAGTVHLLSNIEWVQFVDGSNLETVSVTDIIANIYGKEVTGTGDDEVLTGGDGDDTIDGGGGNDTIFGLGGDDLISFTAGSGGGHSSIYAGTGNNIIRGLSGGGDGISTLYIDGYASDFSLYSVDDDFFAAGADIFNTMSGVDYIAFSTGNGDNVVTLDLAELVSNGYTRAIYGTAAVDVLQGASENETIQGLGGDDTLDGLGGSDRLIGGDGADTYIVGQAGDLTIETADGGIDTVRASLSWSLAAEIENLTLTGTAAISATGNSLENVLTGNSAANTLNGGAGADVMSGGAGNDTYVVDNIGDSISEAASGGVDTVQASLSWTLDVELEKLTLTGTGNINGTGNTLANTLTGNAGDNILNGGTGSDTLVGGAGDDTYVLDVSTDVVTEAASAGIDTVQSSVTLTLRANIERLTLTGTSAINGTGNTLDNILTGNSANNTLDGSSGVDTMIGMLGADTLTGGSGIDTFIFATGDDADTITDFNAVGTDHDIIDLRGLISITSYTDLTTDHMSQSGTNVLIDGLNGDTITIRNATLANLDAGDFLF